jgi:hypothetical protein
MSLSPFEGTRVPAISSALRDELRHLAGPDMIVGRCMDVPAGALLGWCSWLDAKP